MVIIVVVELFCSVVSGGFRIEAGGLLNAVGVSVELTVAGMRLEHLQPTRRVACCWHDYAVDELEIAEQPLSCPRSTTKSMNDSTTHLPTPRTLPGTTRVFG